MLIKSYKDKSNELFESKEFEQKVNQAVEVLKGVKRIYFIGNGGSMAICSHMMEDYGKIARFKTYSFSDPALITCYANDYGYEHALTEWLKLYFEEGDLLIAISSSGNSMNIVNAVDYATEQNGKVITLSGFKSDNKINGVGDVSFHVASESYGIVECLHHTILHIILDAYAG